MNHKNLILIWWEELKFNMVMELLYFRSGLDLISSPCTFNHQSIHHPPKDFGLIAVFQSQLYKILCGTPKNSLESLPFWSWGVG